MLRRFPIRRGAGRRGQALVEFALTIMIVMLLIFWTWELVMVVYTYTVMSGAAKVGVRYAIVNGPDTGTADCAALTGKVQSVVQRYAKYSLHNVSAIGIDVSCPTGINPPAQVTVTVTYAYIPHIKLVPWTPLTIKASAAGRMVY